MFMHNKRLQYTVRVGETNPALASLLLEQFGGPDGELAAAMRYFTQGLGEDDAALGDLDDHVRRGARSRWNRRHPCALTRCCTGAQRAAIILTIQHLTSRRVPLWCRATPPFLGLSAA